MQIDTPDSALLVCTVLQNAGHQAFLVGGCVRDALMGHEPKDWDVTTDALPEKVQNLFEKARNKVIPTGIQHGTVTVMVEGEPIEVTTFRTDGFSSDGRRPDAVEFVSSIQEDLARRDFTCNAIAFDPLTGNLVDPFNGHQDIQHSLIRAVGNPEERFREDGLRLLRAVRFCSTKGFMLDESTAEAIPRCLDMLDKVSAERIRDELLKTVAGDNVGFALNFLMEAGIFGKICPELAKQPGLSQNRHHAWEIWEHTVRCVEAERTKKPILRLAVLLHDIAKPITRKPHPKHEGDFQFLGHENVGATMAREWMNKFRFSGDEIKLVTHCIEHHLIFFTPDWDDRQLRRWLRKVGSTHLDDLLELRRADIVGKHPDVAEELEGHELLKRRIVEVSKEVPHSTAHLAIRGDGIMVIRGIKGGPLVGKIIDHLLDVVTDDPSLNTVEGLTPIIKEFQS